MDAVTAHGGATAVFQHAEASALDDELTGSADLFVTVPRTTGHWLLHVEAATTLDDDGISRRYPTANADAGTVRDADGHGRVQISQLSYTFAPGGPRSVTVGLIDPSAWLDASRISNDEHVQFLNGSFVNNATIEFPDYTLGGAIRWHGEPTRPEVTLVVASSDGLADLPQPSYGTLLEVTSRDRGVFVGLEGGWAGERLSARAGAWLRTDEHVSSDRPERSEPNHGGYLVLGWHGDGQAVDVRAGFANADVSAVRAFLAVAYQRDTDLGILGLGLAQGFLAPSFRPGSAYRTTDVELHLRIPLGRAGRWHLTPSLQYLQNPGYRAPEPRRPHDAVVAGLRLHFGF